MAKHVPERMCIACRTMKPKREMIRLVASDDGPKIDESGKRPGRGAYICRTSECFEEGLKQHRIEQHLKSRMQPEQVEELRYNFMKIEAEEIAVAERLKAERAAVNAPPIEVKDHLGQTVRIKRKGNGRSHGKEISASGK